MRFSIAVLLQVVAVIGLGVFIEVSPSTSSAFERPAHKATCQCPRCASELHLASSHSAELKPRPQPTESPMTAFHPALIGILQILISVGALVAFSDDKKAVAEDIESRLNYDEGDYPGGQVSGRPPSK